MLVSSFFEKIVCLVDSLGVISAWSGSEFVEMFEFLVQNGVDVVVFFLVFVVFWFALGLNFGEYRKRDFAGMGIGSVERVGSICDMVFIEGVSI